MEWRQYNWLLVLWFLVQASSVSVTGQRAQMHGGLTFYHLNTSHGLSDNYVHCMAIDSTGNLWLGTGDGLNMFNGKTVVRFFTRDYPQLQHDDIRQLICDQSNRVWVLTGDGYLALIDEERRFHKITVRDSILNLYTPRILYTPEEGIILLTEKKHYRLASDVSLTAVDSLTLEHFTEVSISGFDSIYQKRFWISRCDAQRYFYNLPDGIYQVNYVTKRVERKYDITGVHILVKWTEDEILARNNETQRLEQINLENGMVSHPFDSVFDQHGKPITGAVTEIRRIKPGVFLFNTYFNGLYLYNALTKQLTHYLHDAADPTTMANNTPLNTTVDKNGWVFIGMTPNGVSYYKSDAVVGQQTVFQDRMGKSYDGVVNTVTSWDNDTYYIGTFDHIIQWKRSTNTAHFIPAGDNSSYAPNWPVVYYLTFDRYQHLWVGTREGVYILDKDHKLIRHLVNRPDQTPVLPHNTVRHIEPDSDQKYVWVSTDQGTCRVDPRTFEIESFEGTRFDEASKVFCRAAWSPDTNNVWLATRLGAFHYNLATDSLTLYHTETGLMSNDVVCFNQDTQGNIYIGTIGALSILMRDGKFKHVTMQDGLLNPRIEALLRDAKNRMWIGNDVGLACFSIADTSVRAFDERYGLSVQGFRIPSYHQNTDDELVWGTERGIQYFYPDNLYDQKVSFPITIHRVETRDIVRDLTKSTTLSLAPSNNYVTFHFSSIDFSKHLRTFYRYKLEGADEDWTRVIDVNSVRYSSLPSGEYTFRVQASNDDREWVDAGNTVTIRIARHFWNHWWFRLLGLILVSIATWRVIRYFRKKQLLDQEELKTQVVINYFASRINSYSKTDDLLWDVAENCISKLHFEDCVIYLVDPVRHVLVQKAAYGPKMDKTTTTGRVDFAIHKPIDIPVGKGIVGSVAANGKSELIGDTTLDARYIVDDKRRYSELAVPMLIDNTVIGVIDSEHSRKHFFTQKHMNILSTIATLCANQIQRVRAEEEKQQAMIEVLKNKQKVTESRLQSLRLQMNPHFLFNALNSIQQMILANEEMVATRYLSRFSKLLRTILIHSDKEMVTLREELDILRLYVDLESVRFKDAFRFAIDSDEEIDIDEVKIPTLLIQPFVENAIWHGLMHKEGDRFLSVNFFEEEDRLHCIIEDNGIGRKKAQELKLTSGHGKDHTSKGIAVSVERLKTMNGSNGHGGSMEIIDLKDELGNAMGTRVEIKMPLQN